MLILAAILLVLVVAVRVQHWRVDRLPMGATRVEVEDSIGLPLRHFDLGNGLSVQVYTPSCLLNTALHRRVQVEHVALFPRFYMAHALVFGGDGRLLHNSVVGESGDALERELVELTEPSHSQ
jgi:hypothetical protein